MSELRFTWNDRPLSGREGDSIASALAAAGVTCLGHSRAGRARSLFCGMGVCHDCLVVADGTRSVRACMTGLRGGMVVHAQSDDSATPDLHAPGPGPEVEETADLTVIGAGPAGLTAAIAARQGGLSVIVLDERDSTGGQYYKPRSAGFRGGGAPDRQHRAGGALRQAARDSGAAIRLGETVWFARREEGGFHMRCLGEAGRRTIRTGAVILATGAYERPAMVPGWTVPGAMTIGAAQTLIRRYGVAPGRRILVAGHGPLGLQLAAELVAAGAEVVALAERSRPAPGMDLLRAVAAAPHLVREGIAYRLALRRARVPVLDGWELVEITGDDRARGAVLKEIATGRTRAVDAEIVVSGEGFAPQLELARLFGVALDVDAATGLAAPRRRTDGATDIPGLWIVGDAGGLGGAMVAEAQGALAAAGALAFLGRPVPTSMPARKRLERSRRFQTALWRLYGAPPRNLPPDNVTLCRCEEVRASAVRHAIAEGATDLGAVKRATRLGMGRCQGRYCASAASRLLAEAGHPVAAEALFAPQVPAKPVTLNALAVEKPEWGGHRESTPIARPSVPDNRPLARSDVDLAIIGGGVTGISAALYAARSGASVLCLDRGRINGEASGGNAGSLHLQLLSWDFGGKAVGDGSLQLRTLPLQQESITLWRTLADELDADFEMAITGGMMVAENPDQIAFLEAKAAAEARVGIATEVIGRDRIREIAPAISDRIVAAAWCAGEGKINPLTATMALARAARAAGAVIEEMAPVTGFQQDGRRYCLLTPRGIVAADRVLIAAGGWSSAVARLIGAEMPIRGAPLQMIVTEPGPPLVPCLLAHADRHLTMKQANAGSVIIGGAWPGATGTAGQAEVLAESLEGNAWVAAHTVPAVGGLAIIRSWAAMNIDIDGAPLIGPVPGLPGVTVAATANGYTLGPLMGREAAAAALRGRVRQDLAAFSIDRFKTKQMGETT